MKSDRPLRSSRTAGKEPVPSGRPLLDAARHVASQAAQEVRLLGGRWKRTPLPVPVAAGLRPTPSRVRETLFNWLGQELNGWRVLDAFAGSGALGFEAASRGAESVCLLEREPALVASLRATQAKLNATQVQVVQADALAWMARRLHSDAGFDLIFLDPPFHDDVFLPALRAAWACVAEGGWIYLEASAPFDVAASPVDEAVVPGLRVHRRGRAGAVHYHLFQRVADSPGVSRQGPGD